MPSKDFARSIRSSILSDGVKGVAIPVITSNTGPEHWVPHMHESWSGLGRRMPAQRKSAFLAPVK